jgi:hypothetical protein
VYAHGSGIRARRKCWFPAVAGSRTGHPLPGRVHAGMILAVFTCRGRPAALNRATLRRHGSLWDGSSLMGTFRRAALRRTALALLSVTGGYCVTPSRFPCSWALRRAGGTRVPRPQLIGNSQPALRESLRRRRERGSGRHLKMAVLVPNRYSSTAASIWKSARGRAGTLRAAAVVRADAMAGTTADHETGNTAVA